MAKDDDVLFGTARRAAYYNLDVWFWRIDLRDTADVTQIFDTSTLKAYKLV